MKNKNNVGSGQFALLATSLQTIYIYIYIYIYSLIGISVLVKEVLKISYLYLEVIKINKKIFCKLETTRLPIKIQSIIIKNSILKGCAVVHRSQYT